MTIYPKYLTDFPNMHKAFPFHISINQLEKGYVSHRHDYIEFSMVIDGCGEESINGTLHPMQAGTFTLVMPYQIHEIYTKPGTTLKLFNCMFSMEILFGPFANLGMNGLLLEEEQQLPSFVQMKGIHHDKMKTILEEMMVEHKRESFWKTALLSAKLVEVLVLFDRYRRQSEAPVKVESILARASVWQIIHFVHTHYREDLSLSKVAQQFNFSVSYLSELFKRYVGQNFVIFLHEVRIRHASGLLISTELNISDIALEVGYGSYKTFSRVFRERKGMTPVAYRKAKSPMQKTL